MELLPKDSASLSDIHALRERFISALGRALAYDSTQGIGGLSEKTLHRVLKTYCDNEPSHHEIEVMGKVADVLTGEHIYEVQRRDLGYLAPKLEAFLPNYRVTIVHPIIAKKRIRWMDRETGEIKDGRFSAHHTVFDTGYELFKISKYLTHPCVDVIMPMLQCDEYRYLDGRGVQKRIKATKIELMPCDLLGQIELRQKEDYLVFLPEGLDKGFTADDYKRLIKSRSRYSYYCLRLLTELGILAREKKGRAFHYYRV